jgi:hypothetical protein
MICLPIHTYIHIYVYIYIKIYMYIHICIYHKYIYVYVCIYICISICIYIRINSYTSPPYLIFKKNSFHQFTIYKKDEFNHIRDKSVHTYIQTIDLININIKKYVLFSVPDDNDDNTIRRA